MSNWKDFQIRDCAKKILEDLAEGRKIPDLSEFKPSVKPLAFRLLKFEGLIKMFKGYAITQKGWKHIKEVGYSVYPDKDSA